MSLFLFFFFNDTATTEIYTLSLHDALPISRDARRPPRRAARAVERGAPAHRGAVRSEAQRREPSYGREPRGDHDRKTRSEEHTSELQSRLHLVCRLLLEKKKKKNQKIRDNN